jgi:hypothetical protein
MKKGKTTNVINVVEVTTARAYDRALGDSYDAKVITCAIFRRAVRRKKPGREVNQATMIVSATGAFMKESMLEPAGEQSPPRHQLGFDCQCFADACIHGASAQYRELNPSVRQCQDLDAVAPHLNPFT